jgi:hypothetical protein
MSFVEGEITVEFGGTVGPAGPAGNAVPIAAGTVLANPSGVLANPVGVDAAGMRDLIGAPGLATANTFAAAQTIEYGVIIADQVSGVGAWSIYKNDGVGSLILRDDVNSRIHATFSEGATNLASNTIFYGPFELRQILTCESQVIAKDAITCRYGVQIADVGGANVGVPQWLVYKLDGVGQTLNFRDVVNSRQHMLLTPGSSNAVAATEIYSRLVVAESASFFGAVVLAIRTIATLPSAASSIGQRYQVSDSATVAYRTVFSNGSAWYYEGTAAAV